jgi:hypothetical protein
MAFATIFLLATLVGTVATLPRFGLVKGYGLSISFGLALALAVMIWLVNSWA